jgi:uncharacterized protein (DUF362 family)
MKKSVIAAIYNENVKTYPSNPPFNPDKIYPELVTILETDKDNNIYSMVRELLFQLGYDAENYNTRKWNPFKDIIKEGDNVVIKPNFAKHEHHLGYEGVICTITHGSVMRPIIDYVNIALNGKGKIVICDTPFEYADFEKISEISGVGEMVRYLKEKGFPIELIDLRKYITEFFPGVKTKNVERNCDPKGYTVVDLKYDSEFNELDSKKQNYHTLADHTVDHYDPFCSGEGVPNQHHNPGKHEYLISKTILNADVIISVPKLKTHGKAGVTLNLKNMIGIVSDKTYMPHHRPGNYPEGDAFPEPPPKRFVKHRFIRRRIARMVYWIQYLVGEKNMKKIASVFRDLILERIWPVKQYKKHIEWGDWYGNDTLWRTILDLNKILFYCDKNGNLSNMRQRKYFSVIDGIIGQEGQGPTMGTPINTSLILGGQDPVATDTIACDIMNLNIDNINVIKNTKKMKFKIGECDKENIIIKCNKTELPIYKFNTPNGWDIIKKEQS